MAEFPALPLFTDAIIADCSHLSDQEFGLYVRLLILIWRATDCKIPNDIEWISRKLRSNSESVLPIMREFCQIDANYVTQKRLQKELIYLREKSKKQSVRSKSRWNKEKLLYRGNADLHESGNAPTPTPTPTPKERNITPEDVILMSFPDLPKIWEDWSLKNTTLRGTHLLDTWGSFKEYWTLGKGRKEKRADWFLSWKKWCEKYRISEDKKQKSKGTGAIVV